jgi:ABC-type transporter Mla maintaining outer membrane lipid asymmetry ATPase subunit MlaF
MIPGSALGMDQRAGLALAAVRHCMVAFNDPLTAGFDPNRGKYLPSIQYRHAGRYCLFM